MREESVMPSERELIPYRAVKGVAVAGRCSKCRCPFQVPLAFDSEKAVKRAHRRLIAKFDQHTCDSENQSIARIVKRHQPKRIKP